QRFPYNPGSAGFGPIYGYQEHINDSDFHIWTFAYDVSGLSSVELKYRLDYDDENPLDNNENETYAGGSGVSNWISIPMTLRDFPAGNVTGNPNIDFFVMPDYIADQYYAEISGYQDTLIDYYVEAEDFQGNVEKSPIQHVFVGNTSGSGSGEYVTWEPQEPQIGDTLNIYYGADGPLFDVDELIIHIGINGWQNVNDYVMEFHPGDTLWKYKYPVTAGIDMIDFCFHDGEGNWDNNAGQDWHVEVTGGSTIPFTMDGLLDDSAELIANSAELGLWSDQEDGFLYIACTPATDSSDIFILFSNELELHTGAPWAKSGEVAEWELFLANEGSNGYNEWYDNNYTSESDLGNVLEGYFNIEQEVGDVDSFYVALGEYQTMDGGSLIDQLPIGDGDTNIAFDEYASLEVEDFAVDPSENDQNISVEIFPNPFQHEVRIKFKKKHAFSANKTKLKIYNIKGALVRSLEPDEISRKEIEFKWYGNDDYGRKIGSGLYFYKLEGNKIKGKIIYLP
ncbi:MAG: hypothetical protein KGY74_11375, partial [Candidatus Cloacimonetes bacterium]|nr:hypothetical protein [Candidatus Cloacimonadota bacterium]